MSKGPDDLTQTDAPLRESLPELKRACGLSYRELAARTKEIDPDGRGLSFPYLSKVGRGAVEPTDRGIALIAGTEDLRGGVGLDEKPRIGPLISVQMASRAIQRNSMAHLASSGRLGGPLIATGAPDAAGPCVERQVVNTKWFMAIPPWQE